MNPVAQVVQPRVYTLAEFGLYPQAKQLEKVVVQATHLVGLLKVFLWYPDLQSVQTPGAAGQLRQLLSVQA